MTIPHTIISNHMNHSHAVEKLSRQNENNNSGTLIKCKNLKPRVFPCGKGEIFQPLERSKYLFLGLLAGVFLSRKTKISQRHPHQHLRLGAWSTRAKVLLYLSPHPKLLLLTRELADKSLFTRDLLWGCGKKICTKRKLLGEFLELSYEGAECFTFFVYEWV